MRKLCFVLLAASLTFPATAFADCKAKIASLERQLEIAKSVGNPHRVRGLETALANTRAHCTEGTLKAGRTTKVEEKQRKVRKAEAELEKARQVGKKEKIAKREEKLEKARQELREAEARFGEL